MPRLLPGTSPETDLYALTDDELSLGRPAVEVAKALLDSGIKILQYREKEKKGRADAQRVHGTAQPDPRGQRLLHRE